jgi:low temperature requirement protein LtrA
MVGLEGSAQTAMARDSYTFIHYFLVAGIILFALGAKKALAHVGEPLDDVPAVALCGGVALYFLGHIAFRWRNLGTLNPRRLAAALALLGLIPFAMHCDAILAMAAVTVVCVAVTGYEATRFAEFRHQIRDGA